jgi:hypothetical protein
MPWVRKGKTVYKKVGGHLVRKGKSKSVKKAKKYMTVLRMVHARVKLRSKKR